MIRKTFTFMILSTFYPLFGFSLDASSSKTKTEVATFAGGCFWCLQKPFDETNGVLKTVVGYGGGHKEDPSYQEVTAQTTGHYEAIQITYDPKQITYAELLDIFWRNIDPTDPDGQFCDKGSSYRSAIFTRTADQKAQATASKAKLDKNPKLLNKVVTPIVDFTNFYPAEENHQQYYKKNPIRYKLYRYNCGRDKRLQELWG